MEVKKDILWRVYLCFIILILFGMIIIGKVFIIQNLQGPYWRSMADSLHTRYITVQAERGTIYSDDGKMLSASIPYFDIRMDLGADGLRQNGGRLFHRNLDSLSLCLSRLFRDRTPAEYRRELEKAYLRRDRYFLLKRGIAYEQYRRLQEFPLFRLGRDKGGLIAELQDKRLNPYGLLGNRTIGLWRENAQNVGLEASYNTYLKGVTGKRLVRRIVGGVFVPVNGYDIDPLNGKDIVTNIDVNIQDIAENALYKMLNSNQARYGTCIVMEVKTGKIRALVNLGRQADGSYWEDYNYALMTTEPGSTFKLATLISVLEDHLVQPYTMLNLYNGQLAYGNRTVKDAEHHEKGSVTVKRAFEISSNVCFSQLAYKYKDHPMEFIRHLDSLKLNHPTGIDLRGEGRPVILTPGDRTWSATTLPWMGFGYEVQLSPLQTLTLYNAVANKGTMMKPYLVDHIEEFGKPVKQFNPTPEGQICPESVLKVLQDFLRGVVQEGTAKDAFKGTPYSVAGKTGTALMANGTHGYGDKIYQSTFVGYFPADHPRYSCIVVVRNKAHASNYYGASVAAPVFREIANKIYALDMNGAPALPPTLPDPCDTSLLVKNGTGSELETILRMLGLPYRSLYGSGSWVKASPGIRDIRLLPLADTSGQVPDVRNMGLKDALNLLETSGLRVSIQGCGRVIAQSIPPGVRIKAGQPITLMLN